MTDRELMRKALYALEENRANWSEKTVAVEALRARLAQLEQRIGDCLLTGVCAAEGHRIQKVQPESEPVFAFRRKGLDDFCTCSEDRYNELAQKPNLFDVKKFYTAPPQREWQGMTDEEINDHWITGMWNTEGTRLPIPEFARAIEAKLKEKNA